MTTHRVKTPSSAGTRQGVARWAGQTIGASVIFGAILFLAAGRLDWPAGWVYLGLNCLTQILSAIVLIPRHPDMLAERSQVREGTKGWDRFFTPAIVIVGTLAVLLTAGLDERFGWSTPLGPGVWAGGVALAVCSQLFVLWAMASNPFFATTVRIQTDRGHTVVQSGPYRFVRHPAYLGSVIYNFAVPLVLDSSWTILPALLTVALIIARTGLEDRTLREELPGYREYAMNVRRRLLPGIW
ncbi:MAG TPA: isoprenylcysteine carboxylmethyltransferase family protein [Anaerolineales bacterium]|nr:isoprenylcysteine carboxylmethyltransferase family protein [Anaerolineales bacterium]